MPRSNFAECLASARRRLNRADAELARTERLAVQKDLPAAFDSAFVFEAEVERLALLARVLPAYTGHPKAMERMEQTMEGTIPVEIGYGARGWFCLRIPALLPKKSSGSPTYIQEYLYPAMRRFFAGKPPTHYFDCVLAYRHIYDQNRPERACRGHDNIEQNMVTDIVALYLLPDDAPLRCAHYYCSAMGCQDQTEVYVIPRELFPCWLEAEKTNDLKEEKLYENRPILR